jgi:hypothetical protein
MSNAPVCLPEVWRQPGGGLRALARRNEIRASLLLNVISLDNYFLISRQNSIKSVTGGTFPNCLSFATIWPR